MDGVKRTVVVGVLMYVEPLRAMPIWNAFLVGMVVNATMSDRVTFWCLLLICLGIYGRD